MKRTILDNVQNDPHRLLYVLHRLLQENWTQDAVNLILDRTSHEQAAIVGRAIQSRFSQLKRMGTLCKEEQRVKSTLLACSIKPEHVSDPIRVQKLGIFLGYTSHAADFRHLMSNVSDSVYDMNPLLSAIEKGCRRTRRVGATAGNPIFTTIWHAATTAHKGTKKRRKMLREKEMVVINGKLKAVSVFVCHQRRVQVCNILCLCVCTTIVVALIKMVIVTDY